MGWFDFLRPTPAVTNQENNKVNLTNHQELINVIAHQTEHHEITNNILMIVMIIVILVILYKLIDKLINKIKYNTIMEINKSRTDLTKISSV